MLMGEYQHTLDNKNRLIMPSKFRTFLGEKFIVTRGLDHCLFVFPYDEWEIIEQKVKSMPLTKGDARAFSRFLFSGAVECEFDKQGRISLPQNLREYARIDKDLVITGVSNRIEIWSKELWQEYMQAAEESYESIAEQIVDLGI